MNVMRGGYNTKKMLFFIFLIIAIIQVISFIGLAEDSDNDISDFKEEVKESVEISKPSITSFDNIIKSLDNVKTEEPLKIEKEKVLVAVREDTTNTKLDITETTSNIKEEVISESPVEESPSDEIQSDLKPSSSNQDNDPDSSNSQPPTTPTFDSGGSSGSSSNGNSGSPSGNSGSSGSGGGGCYSSKSTEDAKETTTPIEPKTDEKEGENTEPNIIEKIIFQPKNEFSFKFIEAKLKLDVEFCNDAVIGEQLKILVTNNEKPVKDVKVNFINNVYLTDKYGTVYLDIPKIEGSVKLLISLEKEGYIPVNKWVEVVNPQDLEQNIEQSSDLLYRLPSFDNNFELLNKL